MKRLILCVFVLAHVQVASAETAFQFTAPGLRAPDDPDVNGVRFSILHGKGQRIRGFDFGLLSLSESAELSGLGLVVGVGKVTGKIRIQTDLAGSDVVEVKFDGQVVAPSREASTHDSSEVDANTPPADESPHRS